MKSATINTVLLSLIFLLTAFNSYASSDVEMEVYYNQPYSEGFVTEFFDMNPDLKTSSSFISLVLENKKSGTEIYLSKNMKPSTTSFFTPMSVSCDESEDEICTTTTKNGRIIKQSCKCTPKGTSIF